GLSESSVNVLKVVVVFLAVDAICGCDHGQSTALFATNSPVSVATNIAAPIELLESATALGMEFKLIPAGTFTMGAGVVAHDVTLTQPFKMGVHEVTQAQYENVMCVNPSYIKAANNPVENVSWEDAGEFCRRLSELPAEKAAGNVYRLPTEAEWEYACRAGTTTHYSFVDADLVFGHYAWFTENSGLKAHPVGSKKPNPWGLYDMHGNVWEWCQDWHDNYPSGALIDPKGPVSGSTRVYRGGGWFSPNVYCWSAYRKRGLPSFRDDYDGSGFRVCLSTSGN
ncbi:formylglycine-generating enzyme family protein, partial [bacterium]|nr:formylglycine-generating enzyme family protein [bacterium]